MGLDDTLLCPGVDTQIFKASCRIPLYPNQWNYWQIWVNNEDSLSWEDMADLIHDALRVWFDYGPVAPFNAIPIHDVRLNTEPYANQDGSPIQRAYRKEDCPLGTTVGGNAPIRVFMRFVYRGQLRDMAFPAFKGSIIAGYSWCPTASDVMVDRVFHPLTDEVPDEKPWYDPVVPGMPEWPELPEWGDPTESWTGAVGWTLLGLGVVVGGYFLLKR